MVKLAAAAVVLILVLAALTLLVQNNLRDLLQPQEEEDEEDVIIDDGVTIVRGDVTWEGKSGVLETPFEIEGTLRLVDCNLTVLFEDLVLDYHNWFEVELGGSLVMENTSLILHQDPRLDNAIHCDTGRYTTRTPFLARALNLQHAEEPVLTFDVSWRGEMSDLVVAVQRTPYDDLEVVEVLETGSARVEYGQWLHYEISLADLAGTIPHLVIFPKSETYDRLFISDVKVTDGGGPLVGDMNFSGDAYDDEWLVSKFRNFGYSWRPRPDLIFNYGALTLKDSQVKGPEDILAWQGYIDTPERLAPEHRYETAWMIVEDMEAIIKVWGGDLTMVRSKVEHMPIGGWQAWVECRDSTILGMEWLVTLASSSATFDGVDFVNPNGSIPAEQEQEREPHGWALSLWDNAWSESMIRNCTFRGFSMGVDLSHMDVELTGCVFRETSWIALWCHHTTGLGGWDEIIATNRFVDCEGHWYLRTHYANVTFEGPNKPWDVHTNYYTDATIDPNLTAILPSTRNLWESSFNLEVCMPSIVVDSNGTATPIETLPVTIVSRWAGIGEFQLDTSGTYLVVRFPGSGPLPDLPEGEEFLWIWFEPENVTGRLNLSFTVETNEIQAYLGHGATEDLNLVVRVDDEVLFNGSVMELKYMEWGAVHNLPVAFSTGSHIVTATIQYTTNGTELERSELGFMRMDSTTDPGELEDYIGAGAGIIMIDPNVTVEVEDVLAGQWSEDLTLMYFLLPEGSSVAMRHARTHPQLETYLATRGPGHLTISDVDWPHNYFDVRDSAIELTNFTSNLTTGEFRNATVHLRDVEFDRDVYLYLREGSDLLLEDSDLSVEWGSYLEVQDSVIRISNVTFIAGAEEVEYHWFEIVFKYNTTVDIDGCTFEDTSMWFHASDDGGWGINVTNCTFRGQYTQMSISWRYYGWFPDYARNYVGNIADNVFEGEGVELILAYGLSETILGENVFRDGALVTAWVKTSVIISAPGSQTAPEIQPLIPEGITDWNWVETDGGGNFGFSMPLGGSADTFRVMILDYNVGGGGRYAVWFAEIDPLLETNNIHVPSWGNTQNKAVKLLHGLGEPLPTWWDD
jgi:hypothetical protein